jgi:hypothetical protein
MTQRLILRDYVQGLRASPHGTKGKREVLNISTGCTLGVFGSDMLDDDQAGGDVVELLADLLAEDLPAATTIRAGELVGGDVVHDPPAFEMRGQRLAAVALASGLGRGCGCRRRVIGGIRLERGRWGRAGLGEDVGGEEQELIRVDLLAGSAEPPAEEPLELMLHMADEESVLAERLEQLSVEAVAGVQVGGQVDGPVFHTYEDVSWHCFIRSFS